MTATRWQQLREIATPDVLPGRFLALWGHADFPDGADDDPPPLDQAGWSRLYTHLENAALEPDALAPLAATDVTTTDGAVPIAIASFRVGVPHDPIQPSGSLDLYEQRVFAAIGWLAEQWRDPPAHRGRDVRFVLRRSLYFTNPGEDWPDKVEVDLGSGFKEVAFEQTVGPYRVDGDSLRARVRCTYGGEQRTAAFTLRVSAESGPPAPDQTWPLHATATDGTLVTGQAWVFRAEDHEQLVNPLILVEGFPGGRPYAFTYELLNQNRLVEALLGKGYDLVIVGLGNGDRAIEHNAHVLMQCIHKVREKTDRPLVVGGIGTGALVARYALAALEKQGRPHGTRAYLSIDAPHEGAYTSVGAQWFVHSLAPFAPALRAWAERLTAPAHEQLQLLVVQDGALGVGKARTAFKEELGKVGGYPRQPEKLAIACGRNGGTRDDGGATTLQWAGGPFGTMTLRALPGDAAGVASVEGLRALPAPDSPHPWETAPGSLGDDNRLVAEFAQAVGGGVETAPGDGACSVPTRSALGADLGDPWAPVKRGETPFDDFVCSDRNARHLELDEPVSKWIATRLGTPPTGFNPYAFDPRDREFLDDPFPTYEQFRRRPEPCFWVSQFQSHWFFRYDDCRAILKDSDTFRKENPNAESAPGPAGILREFPRTLFTTDGDAHAALRRAFDPAVGGLFDGAVGAATAASDMILGAIRPLGGMELVADYATNVPAAAAFALLGIPEDDAMGVGLWASVMTEGRDDVQPPLLRFQAATSKLALQAYLQGLLRKYRRDGRGPGLLGAFARQDGGLKDDADIYASCVDFVIAGSLGTTWAVSSVIFRYHDRLDELRADVPGALERVLRSDAPVQFTDRYVETDGVTLGGVPLARGDRVTAVIGSANRDEKYLGDPTLTFGGGIHRCIGEPLARRVAPMMLDALLALPGLRVAGLPQWRADPMFRGLASLPVRW